MNKNEIEKIEKEFHKQFDSEGKGFYTNEEGYEGCLDQFKIWTWIEQNIITTLNASWEEKVKEILQKGWEQRDICDKRGLERMLEHLSNLSTSGDGK